MKKEQQRELKRGKNEFAAWMKICRHFFPGLPQWLNNMADPRNQSFITYTQAVIVLMCVMKNVSGIVTMRNMNTVFNEDAAIENLALLADEDNLTEMPDWQTANNYLERLDVGELEEIRRRMVKVLLRSRQFDRYKFQGCWRIIFDGTGIAYFKERHCRHDLVTTIKNPETGAVTKMYFHKILEAKLVLSDQVVISLGTEFIENENEDVEKQDCELRAAERLAEKLKRDYPRLPVCILADGLYATMPFMEMCREKQWHYILTVKEGRQRILAGDFRMLVETDGFRFKQDHLCGSELGTGAFRNHMELISDKKETCNLFEYRHDVVEKDRKKTVRFVWVTDLKITMKTLEAFIVTARMRWKIENEGFNNQKNGIYQIEHLCSRNPNAMKGHYLITQISDIVMQLYLAYGNILGCIKRSIKSVAQSVGEYFWRVPLTEQDLELINRRSALRLKT